MSKRERECVLERDGDRERTFKSPHHVESEIDPLDDEGRRSNSGREFFFFP